MEKNIEKEYKVLVSSKEFLQLLNLYPEVVFHKQVNTYYDSKEFNVRKSKGSMRIREINGEYLFTLKKHGKAGVMEFEKLLPENSVKALQDPEIQKLLRYYRIEGPFESFASLTTYRGELHTEDATICFDRNIYSNTVDYEIEYEYKREHDGRTAFNEFLKPIGRVYKRNCTSKIRRAFNKVK